MLNWGCRRHSWQSCTKPSRHQIHLYAFLRESERRMGWMPVTCLSYLYLKLQEISGVPVKGTQIYQLQQPWLSRAEHVPAFRRPFPSFAHSPVTATVCPIKIEVRKQWRHVHVPQLYEQFWSEQNKVLGLGVWPSCLGAIHVGQDEAWETAQLKQPPPTGSLETTKRNPAPRDPTKLDNSELKSFKPIDWEFCLTALFWLIPSP